MLRRAFVQADLLGIVEAEGLLDCRNYWQGGTGAATYRRFVRERIPEVKETRSLLEGIFLDLCRSSDIPFPEVNRLTGTNEIDCRWHEANLLVEVDGYEFHKGREKFEEDVAKSNRLRSEGWTVLRFTWRMLTGSPDLVASQVRNVLQGN